MAKNYNKLCPKLSKHIAKEVVDADLTKAEKTAEAIPNLTKAKVEAAYELLKVDPQHIKIAVEVGLTVEQVKELHAEILAYVNYIEEELTN